MWSGPSLTLRRKPNNNKITQGNNMNITIKYGLSNSITKSVDDDSTVEDVIDGSTLAALNAPEGIAVVRNGNTLSEDTSLYDGDVIYLEQRSSSKA